MNADGSGQAPAGPAQQERHAPDLVSRPEQARVPVRVQRLLMTTSEAADAMRSERECRSGSRRTGDQRARLRPGSRASARSPSRNSTSTSGRWRPHVHGLSVRHGHALLDLVRATALRRAGMVAGRRPSLAFQNGVGNVNDNIGEGADCRRNRLPRQSAIPGSGPTTDNDHNPAWSPEGQLIAWDWDVARPTPKSGRSASMGSLSNWITNPGHDRNPDWQPGHDSAGAAAGPPRRCTFR